MPKLTPEEIERYAPYHTMEAFAWGYEDYNACRNRELEGVEGQAYDRGAELAMRRGRCRQINIIRNSAEP